MHILGHIEKNFSKFQKSADYANFPATLDILFTQYSSS